MTLEELKWANQLFWMVKGHLIPNSWPEKDIIDMEYSYTRRLWGNNESQYHLEGFEEAWKQRIQNR